MVPSRCCNFVPMPASVLSLQTRRAMRGARVMDERDLADRLDRFLDRLATGEAHRGAIDPELAAIARRYHVLGHSSAPAGARQRVRRRIRSRPANIARGNED